MAQAQWADRPSRRATFATTGPLDSIQAAFSVTMTNPERTVAITMSKVEMNKPLDDAIFVRPGGK
jgi:hypothetical protein